MYWVVEENLVGDYHQYSEIKDVVYRHGIHIQMWRTQHNKNSQFFGVTSMARLFTDGNMVLPYGDTASRDLSDKLILQLVSWDESNSKNKNRTGTHDDLVMALWFAWDPIRRSRQNQSTEVEADTGAYDGFDFDSSPWGDFEVAPW